MQKLMEIVYMHTIIISHTTIWSFYIVFFLIFNETFLNQPDPLIPAIWPFQIVSFKIQGQHHGWG